MELVFDPLFRTQLITGLLLAAMLPVLGAYLHLRREWLAALGLSHVAAAGGVLSAALAWPILPMAVSTAAAAAAIKGVLQRAGNEQYAVFLLFGWTVTILISANSHMGARVGEALMDGQLYFTGYQHLIGAIMLAAILAASLPWLSSRLMIARFFPDHFSANGLPGWRYHLAFDVLVVAGLTLATTAIGIMAAFALVFLVPWAVFNVAYGWKPTLVLVAALGVVTYLIAFFVAMTLDQPFGPIMVATILCFTLLRVRRRRPRFSGTPVPDKASS